MKVWKFWMKNVGQSVLTRREITACGYKTRILENGDLEVTDPKNEYLYSRAIKTLCDRGQRFA